MSIRVIAIGNPARGDDAVGPAIGRALAALAPPAEILAHSGEAAGLVELLSGCRAALLVDAGLSGGVPGTLAVLDAADGPLPRVAAASTHALGLVEAVELARALGALPPVCRLYAVEAAQFAPGAPLDPAVAAAVEPVARRLADDVAALAGREVAADA
ncbi:MAG: hydrogenase maturation protease [Azospirillaceae bacterium]